MVVVLCVFARAGITRSQTAWMPYIDDQWWEIARNPDLGKFTNHSQQPVDFAIWQAKDRTWQLWSCIRNTKCGGNTRLFYGWEGGQLTDPDWRPTGIKMEAQTQYGETLGGLQAPYVVPDGNRFNMLYGDWEHICLATSIDGKRFERHLNENGKSGLFGEGAKTNTRDPMAIYTGKLWYGYYTAHPRGEGAVYCRTSPDLKTWGASRIVAFGGRAGTGPYAAECPHVVERHGRYYLFRTQKYAPQPRTSVYASTDPMKFGINQDHLYFVTELPVAAPEIIHFEGQDYIAALLPSFQGIRMAKLGWRNTDAKKTEPASIKAK
jgi:hypothetical protein